MEDGALDFGKYKSKTISEVPLDYVLFLAGFRLEGTKKVKNDGPASQWVATKKPNIRKSAIQFLQGRCWKCNKMLVPVGSSRQNGAFHDDWEGRILHKKCWIVIKKEEEAEKDEEDESD